MAYSEDAGQLREWMPLVMDSRAASLKLAATRVAYGTDVDFGTLTRGMVDTLKRRSHFNLYTGGTVERLDRQSDGRWRVAVGGHGKTIDAGFVFLGAGGAALPLLQKSGIAEGRGYGGFPVSGQWLVCHNPEVIRQHNAKVYGKAPLGAPPMSVPHLDTRIIEGKPALLFGPFAGFSTKFLKQGSWFDLLASVQRNNLKSMLGAGMHNMDLTRYLIGEVLQSHRQRMDYLRQFFPLAKDDEWTLSTAGQRVQIIKHGKLEFGTEIVTATDGSLAALLGASPGASTSVQAMMGVIQRCFKDRNASPEWQAAMKSMVPSYGESLVDDAALLKTVRARTLAALELM
jgi:malate dehydrogenase (quinone)